MKWGLNIHPQNIYIFDVVLLAMVELNPTQLGIQAGSGAMMGGVIGFAVKKVIKIAAAIVGVQLAFLAYLENQGIVTVDWDAINSAMAFTTNPGSTVSPLITNALSIAPIGGGAVLGFAYGFRKA